MQQNLQALLRNSLNSGVSDVKADYDQRNQTMLTCLRKLFAEARS